jgi:cytoskeletal protein CcmA (bactofilin family)
MDNSNKDSSNSIDTTNPDALSSASTTTPEQAPDNGKSSKGSKLPGPLRKYSHRFNIYLLFFVLILVVAGAVLVILAMSSKSTKQDPSAINTQALSTDTLKQLSNSTSTVGDPKSILTVQSNAIFSGKVMIRDSLEVAGQIKVGGPLSLPGITVSGESNFDQLNVNKALSIGGDASIQGQLTVKKNAAISGTGTFGGAVTAPQVTTSNLQLLGDLALTRHIVAGGASPGRSSGGSVGAGGTASVSGSDTAGTININAGGGASAGCMANITFNKKYNNTPHILITPASSDAATATYYVNRSSTGFSLCFATPPTGTSYSFDYFVID